MSDIVYETSTTTHWRNLFESKSMLLGAHNLNPGEELIAEISGIDANGKIKNKKGGEEIVLIASFTNAPDMVLNVTNVRTIVSLYGEYYDKWLGKSIQLYAAPIKAFGAETLCLRIRAVIPVINQDMSMYTEALEACSTMQELQEVFTNIPKHFKSAGSEVETVKNNMKEKLSA